MNREKILIIDDEPGIIDIVVTNLRAEGFAVFSALDGETGLLIAQRERPNLVILDIMMPKMDGWEVVRRLESDPATAGLPVIMLTAKVDDADVLEGLERGAVEYITKPFYPENLVATVRINLRAFDSALREEHRAKLIETRRAVLGRMPRANT